MLKEISDIDKAVLILQQAEASSRIVRLEDLDLDRDIEANLRQTIPDKEAK